MDDRFRQLEQLLLASENRFRNIINRSADSIVVVDREGFVRFVNPAAEGLFGRRASDLVGYLFGFPLLTGETTELDIIRPNRQIAFAEMRVVDTEWENEEAFLALLRDITQRKQTEQALALSQSRLASILDSAPDSIITVDSYQRIVVFNAAAERMFGCSANEALGQMLDRFIPERLRRNHTENIARFGRSGVSTRKTWTTNTMFGLRSNGQEFPIETTISQVESAGQKFYTAIIRDTSEYFKLEAQLRQSQKMESIGQMAGGIAHDFNNILTAIQGYSDLISQNPRIDNLTQEYVTEVNLAASRASNLVRQLLTFSRRQVMQARVLDLNDVVKEVVSMLRRVIGEDIRLVLHYEADKPLVEADHGMLAQVLMNLAVNARDAMPGGGLLTIATSTVEITEEYIHSNPEAVPGYYVCLTVSDTGCGMDEQTISRIFEPFFTTKEVGKGTGLGLSTVYGIIKQHRGWIEVSSAPAKGTAFKLFLTGYSEPAVEGVSPLRVEEEVASDAGATILVVEDELVVRTVIRKILKKQGYRVLEASSGLEALEVWEDYGAVIDLVLTDMVMPGGINGYVLIEKLRTRRPDLKAIYSSGYSLDIVRQDLVAHGEFVFLPKPYTAELLVQTIHKCLSD